jgi:hypothetical protein
MRRSAYRGVNWSKPHKKWRASVKLDGKHIFLGLFDDAFEAGVAVSDFRMQMAIPRKIIQRRGNAARSRGVKAYKENLPPEVARAIALKGHLTRQSNGLLKSNKSGVKGIHWNSKRERWFVEVRVDGCGKRRLGSYKDLDEAVRMAEAFYATGEDPRLTNY